jgi:hypothetical protein
VQYHQAVVNSLVAAVQGFGDAIGTGSVALGPLFGRCTTLAATI